MFSLSIIIIASLISLVVGGIIGFLISGKANCNKQTVNTEDRLTNSEATLQRYQRDVAENFAQTAALVNTLTESYRDMHEHLANSSLKFSTPEVSRQLLSAGNLPPGVKQINISDADIQAPRDWAPKKQGQEGTLSEGYGLEDSVLEESDDDDDAPDTDLAPESPKSKP